MVSNEQVDFVPARWWEAVTFVRLNLEMVRGHDPWADRILARPRSLSSLLEYSYMLDNFFRSNTFFIVVSSERAGLICLRHRPGFVYIEALGLLPRYLRKGLGNPAARFIDSYAESKGYQWGIAAMAVTNRPVHMLCHAFGGHLLGLSTATLTLTTATLPTSFPTGFEVKQLRRPEADKAWQRWRLYEVEHVSGPNEAELAFHLLERLPRGKYLSLHSNEQEIGFAIACQRRGELEVGSFTSCEFWPDMPTANIVATIARYLGSPLHRLILTQTHANTLTGSEPFSFQRNREQERHLVIFTRTRR